MMIKVKKYGSGFTLFELLLALFVLALAITGTYYLYSHSMTEQKNTDSTSEVIAIANVYADLYSAHLTGSVATGNDLINLLYGSNRLSEKYFIKDSSSAHSMRNAYGALSFDQITATGFMLTLPVSEDTDGAKTLMCNNLQDHVSLCTPEASGNAAVDITIDVGGN